uniref:WD_REPEATS_REGION domain-containing protein n=1 Tax=Panagrellus redivivus TaxID=6233 RepID=A0A7E4ZZY3_PANRE
MENITLVSALAWVKRGVAKSEPEKLLLEKSQLADLIHGDGKAEGDEDEGSDAEMEETEEKVADDETADDKEEKEGNIMKGVAVYANPEDDPLITRHADSEDEDEKDDFILKPDDNLVISAKIVKDEPGIDVHVYNEANGDWYVHHDYILDSPPLCIAPIRYDPGQSGKGNLLAVGTFDPIIQIWDLDVVNAIEPIVKLGPKPKKGNARAKRDGSSQGHSDAVTALDWNQLCEHVLASGSADQTVVLWDLDEAKPATIINFFDDKIGSLQWHPVEQSILVAGTRAGKAQIIDARNIEPTSNAAWEMGAEIEQLLWDIHNPFCLLATTDDGKLHYLDSRKPGVPVVSVFAHEDGANAVSQSYGVRGLVATVGENELKLWKLTTSAATPELQAVHTHPVKMGKLFSVEFCPESANTLVVGGEGEEMVRIVELDKIEPVCTAFGAIHVQEDTAMED